MIWIQIKVFRKLLIGGPSKVTWNDTKWMPSFPESWETCSTSRGVEDRDRFSSPNNGGFCTFAHPNRKLVSSYCGSFWKRHGCSTAPKHEKPIALYNLYRYMGCAEVRPRWSCQCFSIQHFTNTNAVTLSESQFETLRSYRPIKYSSTFIFPFFTRIFQQYRFYPRNEL